MLPEDELYYRVALTMVPGIGPRRHRQLLDHFSSAAAVFRSGLLPEFDNFKAVDRTFTFARKHNIGIYCPGDPRYPAQLLECSDAPPILYYKGIADLNHQRILAVVGTRTPSSYGQQMVRSLVGELASCDVLIVSGLADGIDTWAHRAALDNGLPTVGVLGHGLQRIYPEGNRLLAASMLDKGGLLTEYRQDQGPETFHFPMRNRIIAGMAVATVVVESRSQGGSLITAELAKGYHREVFALPGRVTDGRSQGCLALVRDNVAALVTGGADIARMLGWETPTPKTKPVTSIHPLLDLLRDRDSIHLDELLERTGLSSAELAARLLELELEQAIEALPGNRYRLIF
ncbi:DNA-processing protein DprA [Dinghuibacter silviterrae]|uniref:DNA processing protein n=1 Tax=Dinghuibacter silviterrae TaxID=1539049 RepID=A0A4R8DE00_9BACT|nr:DNA-processing protein DprA [Dinghuibacter silviterrae]TDW95711.1 DNA processing protein [Dinghuibacter silviterrae]